MIQQITKGIQISITSNYEGKRYQNDTMYCVFSYHITIKNQSSNTVQLLNRHWNIFDSLNTLEVVEGDGVIGKKPILKPKEVHTYTSFCYLYSAIGAMNGYYTMVDFNTSKKFRVQIPTFQLTVPATVN